MLPFLKKSKESGMAGPIEAKERKPDQEKDIDVLESAMEELHSALMAKNYKHAAEIFRAAQELVDSEPHNEGEHIQE